MQMTNDVAPEASVTGIQPSGNATRSMIAVNATNHAKLRRRKVIIFIRQSGYRTTVPNFPTS